MSLLETVANFVGGKMVNQEQMMSMVQSLFKGGEESSDGTGGGVHIGEILQKFKEKGLGEQVASWVGMGPNAAITGEHIQQVFGSSVQNLAEKFGISSEAVASGMARVLPEIINKATPEGKVPDQAVDMQGMLAEISDNNSETQV